MGPSPYIDSQLTEKSYNEEEYLLRVEFVKVFLKHRNAVVACIELGFMDAYAPDWAKSFMGEGLVRRLISEAERAEETEAGALERQRKYRAWMENQATYNGPGASHGARVSAISQLMKLEGMEPATKTETDLGFKGGVMVVPVITSPDTWGADAAKLQETLKQTVKD